MSWRLENWQERKEFSVSLEYRRVSANCLQIGDQSEETDELKFNDFGGDDVDKRYWVAGKLNVFYIDWR